MDSKGDQSGRPVLDIIWPANPIPCDGLCQPVANEKEWYPYPTKKLSLVLEDAERGCPKCLMIHRSFADFRGDTTANDGDIYRLPGPAGIFIDFASQEPSVRLVFRANTQPPPWDFVSATRTSPCLEARRDEFGPILRSWIDNCKASHTECEAVDPKLPKRVLDVGGPTDGGDIYLRPSLPSENGQYVALSHCWGDLPLAQTSATNLKERMAGIKLTSLPKSFQDAVTLTRSIGIRYLWIDSLCILQGDTTDWQVQSSNMANIYNKAYLVISASQAANSSQGFIDRVGGQEWPMSTLNPSNLTQLARVTNPDSTVSS
ncbi:hypothetical protein OQA88_10816 [Cercophora sp. LCS_1]